VRFHGWSFGVDLGDVAATAGIERTGDVYHRTTRRQGRKRLGLDFNNGSNYEVAWKYLGKLQKRPGG
jgi:hypothetical protein